MHICGADTARLVSFVNDTGQVVGTDSENTLKLALLTVRNDSWDILGAVDLLLNAALQEGALVDRCNMHIFQSIRNQTLQKIEVRNFSFLRSLILQILACRIRNHRTSHFQKSTSPLILSNDSPFASPCLFTILI